MVEGVAGSFFAAVLVADSVMVLALTADPANSASAWVAAARLTKRDSEQISTLGHIMGFQFTELETCFPCTEGQAGFNQGSQLD